MNPKWTSRSATAACCIRTCRSRSREDELSLHYQPQAISASDAAESEVVGFEALARWNHPVRGFVPPSDFIPLAEESGLIVEMGEWILRQACREAASWPKPLQIAVNLSPAQFAHGDVVGLVHAILLETGLAPGRLELEITEGVLIEDFDRGLALLRRLKALGVRISMDDFGSGYSSLSYLQAFPFDKIKIDRAFVMNLGRNPQSAAIVSAVIDLAHGLDMSVVAEGVETPEQLCLPHHGGLRRRAGLSDRQAAADRPICRAGRPQERQCHGAAAQDRLGVAGTFRCTETGRMADYDLAIIGGGLNGASLARDAAGRGLRVILLEQGDLGGAASSASPRLIHGDLSALERRSFARVRRQLNERRDLARPSRRIWCARCGLRSPPMSRAARPGCCARRSGSTTAWDRRAGCRPPRPSTSPTIRSAMR